MISRTVAVLIAIFVPGFAAVAQTASDIDNCCFVDRQCHSDADWTAGYWAYQNGQCPAPQPQAVAQTSAQLQPANIDNCCFVDRQCHSDADWTAGYWAYRNGQCPAPRPQTGAQSSPQTQPAHIDNCCFAGWQCSTDGDWSAGFSAYQANLCERREIHLNGSPSFVFWMNAALDTLKTNAPEWYVYVITGLREIKQYPDHELLNIGAFADLGKGQMGIAGYDNTPFQGAPSLWEQEIYINLASVMAHEACHVHMWQAGIWFGEGWRNELPCHEADLNALYRIVPPSLSWMIAREQKVINNYRQHRTWWGAGPYPFS